MIRTPSRLEAHAAPTAPWRPSAFIVVAVALHAVGLAMVALAPASWPWALALVAAVHVALTAAGLWPRSRLLGPNVLRLDAAAVARGEVAITIDDGPDPDVTPAVLDLLDARGARATFFCIARRAESHPALAREIVARGHSVQNHSDVHSHRFSLSLRRGFVAELTRAQERLTRLTGERPTCFRAPAGLRNPFLDPVLHHLGLRLVSWTRRGFDTRESDPQRVLARLVRGLAAGDILLLHDGHAARTAAGRPVVLDVLPPLLDAIARAGLRTVTLPQAMGGGDALAPARPDPTSDPTAPSPVPRPASRADAATATLRPSA